MVYLSLPPLFGIISILVFSLYMYRSRWYHLCPYLRSVVLSLYLLPSCICTHPGDIYFLTSFLCPPVFTFFLRYHLCPYILSVLSHMLFPHLCGIISISYKFPGGIISLHPVCGISVPALSVLSSLSSPLYIMSLPPLYGVISVLSFSGITSVLTSSVVSYICPSLLSVVLYLFLPPFHFNIQVVSCL